MNLFRVIVFILVFFQMANNCFAQSERQMFHLKDGSYINGVMYSESDTTLTIQTQMGLLTLKKTLLVENSLQQRKEGNNADSLRNGDFKTNKASETSIFQRKIQPTTNPVQNNNYKANRLYKAAQRYSEEELRERIRRFRGSKHAGQILLGTGIPMVIGGFVLFNIADNELSNTSGDYYEENNSDDALTKGILGIGLMIGGGVITTIGIV